MLSLKSETTGTQVSTINLSKVQLGERINLSKDNPGLKRVLMKLVWTSVAGREVDLDATIAQLGTDDKFVDAGLNGQVSSMVFFQNENVNGISHSGDLREGGTEEITVTLDQVRNDAKTLLFIASAHAEEHEPKATIGQASSAKLYIIDADANKALYEIDLAENVSTSTCVELGRLYRHENEWKLTSLGTDIGGGREKMGLYSIINQYAK